MLNPIDIKIFEETAETLKMKINLRYFTDGIVKTLFSVPKTSTLAEFVDVLRDVFVLDNLEINFMDLQRNQIDLAVELSDLPENNEFFIQVNGDLRTRVENVK